jgi:hypothetical protein
MRKIQHPEQLLAERDPITLALAEKYGNVNMPNLRVSDDDANYMIGYLVSRTSELQRQARARNAGAKPTDGAGGTARPNQ